MYNEGIKPIPFASIIGKLLSNIPYNNQKNTPTVRMLYIQGEMLWVSRVFMTFSACGNCEIAEQTPAI